MLTKDYSVLRRCPNKWRSFRKKAVLPMVNRVEFNYEYKGEVFAVIYNRSQGTLDGYKLSQLAYRVKLKRDLAIFKSIYKIWGILNERFLKDISKDLWIRFL